MLDFREEDALFLNIQMNSTHCSGFNVHPLEHGVISPADNLQVIILFGGLYSANSCISVLSIKTI